MRVRFQTPIQATDRLTLEFKEVNKQWAPFAEATGTSQFLAAGSKFYGVKIDPFTGNTTDVDVIFYNSGYRTTSGTYAQDGSPWSDLSTTRWRLRKVSSGAAVGFPVEQSNVTIAGIGNGLFTEEGSYSAAVTGAITGTATVFFKRVGKLVTLSVGFNATAGTTTNTISLASTNNPVRIRPTTAQVIPIVINVSGNYGSGLLEINTSGSLVAYRADGTLNWTSGVAAGVGYGPAQRATVAYMLTD